MKIEVMENLNSYFYDAIHSSILAMREDVESIINYYGDAEECTLRDYFRMQIKEDMLYNSVDEQDTDTLICEIDSNTEYEFDDAREKAFRDYLQDLQDSIDEDDLIELSESDIEKITEEDSIEVEPGKYEDFISYYRIKYKGRESDMQDTEVDTTGDDLFCKIYSLMNEYTQPDIRKAALIAGAKYLYVEQGDNGSMDYTVYFWKPKKITFQVSDLEDLIKSVEGVAWQGWHCEIFASAEEVNGINYLILTTGDPLSNGYTPSDNVVGKLDTWYRHWEEADAEEFAEECNCAPADFDCEEQFKIEASTFADAYFDAEFSGYGEFDTEKENSNNTLFERLLTWAYARGYDKLVIE